MRTRQRSSRRIKTQHKWSAAQRWLARGLASTRLRWTRKSASRFWQFHLGVAVVLIDDTPEWDPAAEFSHCGVISLGVRSLNEPDLAIALEAIRHVEPWNRRRTALGLPPVPGAN
jgi:hypothetical protein